MCVYICAWANALYYVCMSANVFFVRVHVYDVYATCARESACELLHISVWTCVCVCTLVYICKYSYVYLYICVNVC